MAAIGGGDVGLDTSRGCVLGWPRPRLVRGVARNSPSEEGTASGGHLGEERAQAWLDAAHLTLELYGDHPALAYDDRALHGRIALAEGLAELRDAEHESTAIGVRFTDHGTAILSSEQPFATGWAWGGEEPSATAIEVLPFHGDEGSIADRLPHLARWLGQFADDARPCVLVPRDGERALTRDHAGSLRGATASPCSSRRSTPRRSRGCCTPPGAFPHEPFLSMWIPPTDAQWRKLNRPRWDQLLPNGAPVHLPESPVKRGDMDQWLAAVGDPVVSATGRT